MVNSTSVKHPLPLTVLIICVLLTLRNGLENKTKVKASNMVDFPEPFSPIINDVGCLSNSISVKVSPVLRKFFHLNFLNCIMLYPPPQNKYFSTSRQAPIYPNLYSSPLHTLIKELKYLLPDQ